MYDTKINVRSRTENSLENLHFISLLALLTMDISNLCSLQTAMNPSKPTMNMKMPMPSTMLAGSRISVDSVRWPKSL